MWHSIKNTQEIMIWKSRSTINEIGKDTRTFVGWWVERLGRITYWSKEWSVSFTFSSLSFSIKEWCNCVDDHKLRHQRKNWLYYFLCCKENSELRKEHNLMLQKTVSVYETYRKGDFLTTW